jgi:GAF domain-containing protein
VLPALKNGEVVLVLDVDSEKLNDFGEADLTGLKQIMEIIEKII